MLQGRSRRLARFGVVLLFLLPCASGRAHAAWPERPGSSDVASFAKGVDSVDVWSVGLPDSTEAAGKHGSEVLEVAHLRKQAVMSRKWGRQLAEALLTPRNLDRPCVCRLEKSTRDTAEVVAPVAAFHIGDEVMWVAMSFRDSCAMVFLPQGPWGPASLEPGRSLVLALFHEALPAETAFARDSFPPLPLPKATGPRMLFVEELPEVLERVPPEYPQEAIQQGISGTVVVKALVTEDGAVGETVIAWSIPTLDAAAAAAVRRWRFRPAKSNGKPVRVWIQTPVRFRLH